MLIALTTGHRCQTLTLLDTSEKFIQRNADCFNIVLTEHLKQDRPGKACGNARLFKYPVKELCVYEKLDHYVRVTKSFTEGIRLAYLCDT